MSDPSIHVMQQRCAWRMMPTAFVLLSQTSAAQATHSTGRRDDCGRQHGAVATQNALAELRYLSVCDAHRAAPTIFQVAAEGCWCCRCAEDSVRQRQVDGSVYRGDRFGAVASRADVTHGHGSVNVLILLLAEVHVVGIRIATPSPKVLIL